MAKPFGLLRGEKRTNAKHVPVRALYAAMNAGAEPPDFRPVPPELTMGERLRLNGYQKEEREKQRQQAIDHNNAQRRAFDQAGGRRAQAAPVLDRKAGHALPGSSPAGRERRPSRYQGRKTGRRGRERAEAREGQAQALDKLLDAKGRA